MIYVRLFDSSIMVRPLPVLCWKRQSNNHWNVSRVPLSPSPLTAPDPQTPRTRGGGEMFPTTISRLQTRVTKYPFMNFLKETCHLWHDMLCSLLRTPKLSFFIILDTFSRSSSYSTAFITNEKIRLSLTVSLPILIQINRPKTNKVIILKM